MKQKLGIILIATNLLGSILLESCTGNAVEQAPTHCVMLAHPKPVNESTTKNFSGIVKESKEIQLAFRTPGQIEKVYVKKGDYVKEGETIAQLDTKDYMLEMQALQIQYDQMKTEVERMQQLYLDKSISGNDYEKAKAALDGLETKLQLSRNKLSYTTLKASTDGYVQDVMYEQTEMINSGSVMVNLIDLEHMEVECDIPASLYMKRHNFLEFSCHSNLSPKKYDLQLISILPKADNNQLYKMRLLVDKQDLKGLTAGMNVTLNISLGERQDNGAAKSYGLPLKSIFAENGKSYLWVVNADSVIHKKEIVFHNIDAHGQAIVSGNLSESDQIVRAGVNALHEGEKVRIIDEPQKTNVGGVI